VRDSLLDPELDDAMLDIDIATDLLPPQTVAAVAGAGLKAIPTGIAHGTVTVVALGRRFEVTTLRQDVATDGRHARVAFGTTIEADAARRDFTINALYALPDGAVLDPLGGLPDLAARTVRFIGDPDRRILEDHLRILRFFRFYARFGQGSPDRDGFAACVRHRDRLRNLSAERISAELFKLLAAPRAVLSLLAMQSGQILEVLDLGPADPARLEELLELRLPVDPVLHLAALLRQDEPKPGAGERVAARLKLSAAERGRLEALLGQPFPPIDEAPSARHRRWYREGIHAWRDRFILAAARGHLAGDEVRARLAEAAHWTRPDFPLRGGDVLAQGVSPGPDVRRRLRMVEEWWLEQDMAPDRAACLNRLQTLPPPLTNHP
jgi:poly(A) polymerase